MKISTESGYAITETPEGLLMNDDRLCEALAHIVKSGVQVLIHRNELGNVFVHISYGSEKHDKAVEESFDTAEWGTDPSLLRALRFAVGEHYGSHDEDA